MFEKSKKKTNYSTIPKSGGIISLDEENPFVKRTMNMIMKSKQAFKKVTRVDSRKSNRGAPDETTSTVYNPHDQGMMKFKMSRDNGIRSNAFSA